MCTLGGAEILFIAGYMARSLVKRFATYDVPYGCRVLGRGGGGVK